MPLDGVILGLMYGTRCGDATCTLFETVFLQVCVPEVRRPVVGTARRASDGSGKRDYYPVLVVKSESRGATQHWHTQ